MWRRCSYDWQANLDAEWKLTRTRLWLSWIHKKGVLPPPFNLLYLLLPLLWLIKRLVTAYCSKRVLVSIVVDEEVYKKDFKSVNKPGLSDPSLIVAVSLALTDSWSIADPLSGLIVHHKQLLSRFCQLFPTTSHSTSQFITLLSGGSEGTVGCRPKQSSNPDLYIRITNHWWSHCVFYNDVCWTLQTNDILFVRAFVIRSVTFCTEFSVASVHLHQSWSAYEVKNNWCFFEMLFKIKKNGVFLFGTSSLISEHWKNTA